MKYLILIFPLLLGGCESFYANLIQDYNDGRGAIRNYIAQNIATRDWVRRECQVELQMELQQMRQDGKHGDARALLREAYPPVVTSAMIEDYQDKDSDVLSSINIPHICTVGE